MEQQIDRAVQGFCRLNGVDEDLANHLVGEGYLSYDDLSVIEPDDLMRMGELTAEQVDAIVLEAEGLAEEAEQRAAEEKRARRAEAEREKLEQIGSSNGGCRSGCRGVDGGGWWNASGRQENRSPIRFSRTIRKRKRLPHRIRKRSLLSRRNDNFFG